MGFSSSNGRRAQNSFPFKRLFLPRLYFGSLSSLFSDVYTHLALVFAVAGQPTVVVAGAGRRVAPVSGAVRERAFRQARAKQAEDRAPQYEPRG